MGTNLLQLPILPSLTSLPILRQKSPLLKNKVKFIFRCLSHRSGGRFQFEGDPYFDGSDDDGEFEFAGAKKQRMWWSDIEDDLGGEDFEGEDEHWIFKIYKAFGLILPAIAISVLLGTGPNAFLMTLAVPLGQSILSLVFDNVKGRTSGGWKSAPRTKTKRKPFATATNKFKTRKARQEDTKNESMKTGYQSWAHTADNFHNKGAKWGSKYGGWDQLDMEGRSQSKASSLQPNQSLMHEGKDKLSRMGRFRDRPLLLRLLIAFFPFLGSLSRFLF